MIYPSINGGCWRVLHLLAIWKHKEGDELNMQLSFHRDRRALSACIRIAAGTAGSGETDRDAHALYERRGIYL